MSAPMFRVTPALFRLVSVVVVVPAIFVPDLSDGASVQIPEGVPTATSTILMDVPSSLSQQFIKSQSVVPGVSSPFQGLSLQTGRSQTTSLIEERIQSSHVVDQCRAMCLEKYSPNEDDIDDIFPFPSLSPNEMEQETATPRQSGKLNDKEILLLLPNLLRFKRQRRSTPFSCTSDLSSDCYSCWNSCQLLEESSGNIPEAVPTTTLSDAKTEQGTPSILPCSNNKHCTSGCQVACSFYEQMLLENGGMLLSEDEIEATTILASEDIAVTTEVTDNGEIEVTQVSWEDESQTFPAITESLDEDKIPTTTTVVPLAPFELHLVSLIHQKSLVIAELRWEDMRGNPTQEYLITWELTGGGLKGHLVTDSTSVTLSLWPDTTYQIQVEQFHQNLDSDGEQPAENSESSTFVKSLPLIVDTSVASFPLHSPLLIDDEENDDDDEAENYSEDEFTAFEVTDKEDLETCYKSIGLIVAVVCAAVLFVLVLLVVVSCAKIRLQRLSSAKVNEECDSSTEENGCFPSSCLKGCESDEKDIRLLVSKEESRHSSIYSWPFHYVLSEKKNDSKSRHSNLKCQQNEMPAIAVISPISPVPMNNATHDTQVFKFSHCYSNSVFSESTSDLPIVL